MSGTAMVFKYGLTELNTKECGKMVKPQEKANLFMLMEMSTMDSGRKTKLAVTECTFTTTEQNTRDNGLKTTSTDTVYKNGWTVVVMKVCTNKAKNMERENTVGETVAIIMETGYKIKSQGMDNMYGLMDGNMQESGSTIKCTEEDSIAGKMEEGIKENISMIKNMDLEFTHGPMAESMQDSGSTAKDMEEVKSQPLMELKDKEYGNRTNESGGQTKVQLQVQDLAWVCQVTDIKPDTKDDIAEKLIKNHFSIEQYLLFSFIFSSKLIKLLFLILLFPSFLLIQYATEFKCNCYYYSLNFANLSFSKDNLPILLSFYLRCFRSFNFNTLYRFVFKTGQNVYYFRRHDYLCEC